MFTQVFFILKLHEQKEGLCSCGFVVYISLISQNPVFNISYWVWWHMRSGVTATVVNVRSIRPYAAPVPWFVSGFDFLKTQLKLQQHNWNCNNTAETATTHIRIVFPAIKCLNLKAIFWCWMPEYLSVTHCFRSELRNKWYQVRLIHQ